MTQIGIQISSVRKYLQTPEDVLTSFQKVSQIGYRNIQIQWIAPEVPAEFIRDALVETRMQCAGTQDYFDVVASQWDEVIAMNDLWGGKSVCVSGIPERYHTYEGCLAFARELDRRSKELEARGLVLAFHPRVQDVLDFDGRNSLEILLENTRTPFQFCLDLYHIVKAGFDPVEWIHRLEGRCDLVHFKDMLHVDGKEILAPIGQGEIDWKPVFQACTGTGVKIGFAEQESWQKDPFECLKESYDYIVANGIKA